MSKKTRYNHHLKGWVHAPASVPVNEERVSLSQRTKAHAKAHPNDSNPTINKARGEEE